MNTQPILHVDNLSKSFMIHEQSKLIPSSNQVNCKVFSGQLTALVGPTGSGKSSVLKSIFRTYKPTSGRILYTTETNEIIDLCQADEHQILNLRKRDIGFVTQFFYSLPRQSTLDIITMPLLAKGVKKSDAINKARDILALLNVPERLWGISPATFSGGEKQRVNLACGLLAEPRLLLLDEPTASLDAMTTSRVIDIIDALKSKGTALLAIFHDQKVIDKLSDHIVTLTPPAGTEAFFEEKIA